MHRLHFTFSILFLASLLAGCANLLPQQAKALEGYRMPTDVPAPVELTQTIEADIASKIPPKDCPVTTPSMKSFEAPAPFSPVAPWEGFYWFGSNHLWTALRTDGVWTGLPHNKDGYTQKIPWWSSLYSLKDEPEPALVVTGKRLDAEAPPLKFYGATNAFAEDMGEAMMTGVDFPTLGCWEVTGQYKKTELKFVVWLAP